MLYAVYRLAEHFGIRFSLHGDIVPDKQIPFILPEINETNTPLFRLRGILHDLVEEWAQKGLFTDKRTKLDFERRLVTLWNDAGKPKYPRSPRCDLVSEEMYEFLRHPKLLDLAGDLLGTNELSVHGIFNARPKLSDQKWTDTPWQQDVQYYRDAEHVHVVSIWVPLQKVTEHNSCLQVHQVSLRIAWWRGTRARKQISLVLTRKMHVNCKVYRLLYTASSASCATESI